MPHGPGVYDQYCSEVLAEVDAATVVLVVIEGNRGNGFSVTTTDPNFQAQLPSMLRDIANQIEKGE